MQFLFGPMMTVNKYELIMEDKVKERERLLLICDFLWCTRKKEKKTIFS